jgi:hypothetical protein
MIVRQQLDNKYRIDIVISDQVCEILLFHHGRGWEEKWEKVRAYHTSECLCAAISCF